MRPAHFPRTLLLALAMLLLATLTIGPAALLPAAHADPEDGGTTDGASTGVLDDFGSCLAADGTGSIVLLLDQSGSLARTDPDKARVTGADFLLDRLADFADRTGYSVDVRVAGYAADYTPRGDWTSISASAAGELKKQVAAIGDDLQTHDTDYWTALEYARQDLGDHTGNGNDQGSACQAVLWFSDGEFDVDPRDTSAEQEAFGTEKPYAPGVSLADETGAQKALTAGKKDLCRDGGLADQLRSSGVSLVGIGLTSSDTDFTFMRSVTEGGGDNAEVTGADRCGKVSSPPGAFFEVDDLDALIQAFDAVTAPGEMTQSDTTALCQGAPCTDGEVTMVLDPSVNRVRILARVDVPGATAYVVPPGAKKPVTFPQADVGTTSTTDGIHATWLTENTVELTLDSADITDWDGQWRVGFFDPDSSSKGKKVHWTLHFSSPLEARWTDLEQAELRQGESVESANVQIVDVRTKDGADAAIDPTRLRGGVKVTVTLTDAAGTEHTLLTSTDKSALAGPGAVEIPADAALGSAKVTTRLELVTADATASDGSTVPGTALDAASVTQRTEVLPPLNYPIPAREVDFGLLEKDTESTEALTVTGPGCVWIDPDGTTFTGTPSGAGDLTVGADATSEDTATCMEEGEEVRVPLTLTAEDAANGAVRGTVTVMIAPADAPDEAQPVTVPFHADMRRPLDVEKAWTTFALVLALGVLIPVAGLYGAKLVAGRIPRGPLLTAAVPVRLPEPGQAARIDLGTQDLLLGSVPAPTRELHVDGYLLRSHPGLAPTTRPWVELSGAPDSISGASPGVRRGAAVLPVGVRGNWIAVKDRSDPEEVTLLVLLGADDPSALDRVLQDARHRLGDRVRSLGEVGEGGEAAAGTEAQDPPPTPPTPPSNAGGWG
jgi:hypothetical protein